MINPGAVVDAVVAGLKAVPDLLVALGGNEARISDYCARYPQQVSLTKALVALPQPGILVAYRGFAPARRSGGNSECWVHSVSVYLRCGQSDAATATEALRPVWLLVEGVPSGQSLALKNYEFHPALEAMNVPSCQLQQLVVDQQGTVIEYWELQLRLVQKDDSSE